MCIPPDMPYKRRTYKKKRKYRRKRKPMTLMRSPVPLKMATKLRYQETISIDPGLGVVGAHIFKANGCYDPNYTSAGHQPRGFDQFVGTLYDHFVVIGSRIRAEFVNTDATYDQHCIIALRDAFTVDDLTGYLESSNQVNRVVGQADGAGSNRTQLSLSFNNKFLGRSKPLADPELKGSAVADPAELATYHLVCKPVIGATNPAKVYISVVIDYLVVLIEPKNPGQS